MICPSFFDHHMTLLRQNRMEFFVLRYMIYFLNLKNNNSDQDVMKNIEPADLL